MENFLILDATAMYNYGDQLRRQGLTAANLDYRELDATFNFECKMKLALVAVDINNTAQKAFLVFMEKLGYTVDAVGYRDAFILPDKSNPYMRLSTRVTYVAGMLSHKQPHLIVVTDDFAVCAPLLDLVQTRGCKVTLAFFRSAMETRWQRVGLYTKDFPIEFLDLDQYSQKIVGVDLLSSDGRGCLTSGLKGLIFRD